MARSPTNESTLPEREDDASSPPTEKLVHGLICVACADEPSRIGTFVLARSSPRAFGRGSAAPDDPAPRAQVVRVRPGRFEPVDPPQQRALSRVQLLLRRDGEKLVIDNVGRCRMSVNGEGLTQAELKDGDVVELGRQIAFLVALRRRTPEPMAETLHPFGGPDELGLVGESELAWQLRRQIRFVRERGGHALVRGESGAGKEMIARALVGKGPFITRNAATFPETLIDSELFGNERGYPNPGTPERAGLIGAADGGTLFLDEIAELPVELQPRLLRVLDQGEYQRLGETKARKAAFRLIGATNRPLSSLREDLLARFAFRIEVPPLSARREDVALIARHLLNAILRDDAALRDRYCDATGEARVSSALLRQMLAVDFAGNVRGLRQLLVQSLMTSRGAELDAVDFGGDEPAGRPAGDPEAERLAAALRGNGGSVDKTWRALGMTSRFVLQRLMKKHGISTRR